MNSSGRLNLDELANLGGVSRRTVRYYIQEGLLPPPLGVGRGRHYDRTHLDRILHVKALQESGHSLNEIRRQRGEAPRLSPAGNTRAETENTPDPYVKRSTWRRLALAPDVELHVGADVRLPGPGRLAELAAWCRLHLTTTPTSRKD